MPRVVTVVVRGTSDPRVARAVALHLASKAKPKETKKR